MDRHALIVAGLRELGFSGFSVLGETVEGIDSPPSVASLIEAGLERQSRNKTNESAVKERQIAIDALLDRLLIREASRPDAPEEVKDYARRL